MTRKIIEGAADKDKECRGGERGVCVCACACVCACVCVCVHNRREESKLPFSVHKFSDFASRHEYRMHLVRVPQVERQRPELSPRGELECIAVLRCVSSRGGSLSG